MKRIFVALLLLLGLGSGLMAQTTPDLKAYRLFFTAITDDTLTNREAAHLKGAGVIDAEKQAVHLVLTGFKIRYAKLVEAYNNSPNTLAGTNVDTNAFLIQLDMLVQSTIDQLKSKAPVSYPDFDDKVNSVMATNEKLKTAQPVASIPMKHEMMGGGMGEPEPMPQGGAMTPVYDRYLTYALDTNPLFSPIALTTSMFYGTGLGNWNPAAAIDSNPSTVAFDTNNSAGGVNGNPNWVYWTLDFGSNPQPLEMLTYYMSAAGSAANWQVWWTDDSPWQWHTVVTNFIPSKAGSNVSLWAAAGAHRHWAFVLTNTPGLGPTVNEIKVGTFNSHMMYITNTVEGYTSGCSGVCSTAKHQGVATNTINGVGSDVTGNWVSPPTWISISNYNTYDFPPECFGSPQLPVCQAATTDESSKVMCTIRGILFSIGIGNVPVLPRSAFTGVFDANTSGTPYPLPNFPNARNYAQTNGCVPPTNPPDMPVPKILELDGAQPPISSVAWGWCLYAFGFPINCANRFIEEVDSLLPLPVPGSITFESSNPPCACTKISATPSVSGLNCLLGSGH
jgi:hypothetical protein